MPIDSGNLALKGLDELFTTEEKRQEEQREQVQQIPIDELHPFTNHPFKVVDDEAMTRTVESIAQFGVLAPLIARPRPDGDGYEIISGHRRQFAAKMAGLETLPVIVRDMDDDAATILMVDSNLQREHISPSERAFAYKMKMDAMKRTAGRPPKENPRQLVGNFETADLIGKESGESGRQVQRFIRLTNLIPELLDMVDEKKVSFNPAVELSYLSHEQQQEVINAMDDTQNAPSFSQAKRIKKLAQEGNFTSEAVVDIMGEEKKSEQDTVTIKNETLRKYFPRSYTPRQMEEKIIQLLDVRIYDAIEDEEGRPKRVLNKTDTMLAQQKQQVIKDAFANWIWQDPRRRIALVKQYNELFNSNRPREYDGSHIHFVGMNPEISLREHQRNAIAHVLYGGNTLLAHEVGAGKTFEMAASAMEAKRLGLCQKSLFVVPNHLTEQWAAEFLHLYPNAKLLVARKKDFETANRKKFCARIATGDYDAVIIGHSQFERIPLSYERQERIIQEQIDETLAAINELKATAGENFSMAVMCSATLRSVANTDRSMQRS